MTSSEAKRFLSRLGASFEPRKGGHLKVTLNNKTTILPMHGKAKQIATGTWQRILKDLGLK